jgi:DUF4097 and DUF4098 domain-containing protein YvlB
VKQLSKFAGTATLAVCLTCAALAQQGRISSHGDSWSQDNSGNVPSARNLLIKSESGSSVRVVGGSQQGINYVFHSTVYTSSEQKARRQLDSAQVSTGLRGDTAFINIENASGNRCTAELLVNVPNNMQSIKIESEGGNVVVTGIAGSVSADTGGGSIKVDDIGGSVTAETGGDIIEVGTVGGDVKLETGGGRITVREVKGKITASTGGGDMVIYAGAQGAYLEAGGGNITVKQCSGRVRVSTGGGNIELGDVTGPVEMETGGGSIRLASSKSWVKAETGAGRIELNGVGSARAETGAGGIVARFISTSEKTDSSLQTSAGDITVYIAPGLQLSVRASIDLANGHTIRSDFSDIHINSEGGDWGPRTISAEGSLNGGGPTLKLSTTTGDIRILRAAH